jgi:adenosylcobinamide kinase/adenosylcobinamide-phosphate guanylyltransferase
MLARAAGIRRGPGKVIIDGELTLRPGTPPVRRTAGPDAGHEITEIPGGWVITAPDGARLLAAAGPGQVPAPPAGPGSDSAPCDIALLDLLTSPAHLGRLRADGLVSEHTAIAALYTDHRIASEQEMTRRCRVWGVVPGTDGLVVRGRAGPRPAPPARPHRTLILGGARSGKSSEAELRLAGEPSVTYLAAGPWPDDTWAGADGQRDAEWESRVAAHRAARPSWWRTQESLDVAGFLRRETGALLIDGIGTWLAAIMTKLGAWSGPPAGGQLAAGIDELVRAWRETSALVVAVSDEVGSGLVPEYPAGRQFRDQLGWLNQRLAAESELTLLVTAGKTVAL